MVGREVLLFFFNLEVLMLKYTCNKTYPYLLSFLHPSVQAHYIIHNYHFGMQKTQVFRQLIQTSTKFCHCKIVLKHFQRKTMKIKNNKIIESGAFSMAGQGC